MTKARVRTHQQIVCDHGGVIDDPFSCFFKDDHRHPDGRWVHQDCYDAVIRHNQESTQ